MAWIKKITLVSAIALFTTSCNMYKLEELRHTTPSGTPFQNELSRMYMDFSAQEEKEYDWFNSWHFADKGLMLAYGNDAGPEDLKDWDIPAEALPDLQRAREELMAVLTPDLMRVSPSRAAEAQFYFDCWVKYQEGNWQEDEIANCRDNLEKTLEELHAPGMKNVGTEVPAKVTEKKLKKHHAAAVEKPKEPAEATEEKKEIQETMPESTSYAVFFEAGKAEVSEPGMNVITEVIKSLRDASDYVVILHNSKDHPGKAAERIQVVKKLLVAGGVKEASIRVGNGKAEIESGKPVRRVEIFLNE